jgi:hypothetical protein
MEETLSLYLSLLFTSPKYFAMACFTDMASSSESFQRYRGERHEAVCTLPHPGDRLPRPRRLRTRARPNRVRRYCRRSLWRKRGTHAKGGQLTKLEQDQNI